MVRFGRVAAIHPEDNSVDLVMVDDGSRVAGVQVLAAGASSNTGLSDLPAPSMPSGGKWSMRKSLDRDIIAATLPAAGGKLVVIGFLFPQICEMLFKEPGRMLYRHQSDVHFTVDDAGNTELFHPSGTYLRIGETPAHEDLTAKDFDKRFKAKRNTGRAVHVRLDVVNGGVQKASVAIDPAGNLDATFAGHVAVTAAGPATVTAPSVTLDTPETTMTGNCTVQGNLAVSGGSLTHQGVNVGSTHKHTEQGDFAEVSTPH
jgi:hypothetical protein